MAVKDLLDKNGFFDSKAIVLKICFFKSRIFSVEDCLFILKIYDFDCKQKIHAIGNDMDFFIDSIDLTILFPKLSRCLPSLCP